MVEADGKGDWAGKAAKLGTGRTAGSVEQLYLRYVKNSSKVQPASGAEVDVSAAAGADPPEGGSTYRAAEDETVQLIAKWHGSTTRLVLDLNRDLPKLFGTSKLLAGTELQLPPPNKPRPEAPPKAGGVAAAAVPPGWGAIADGRYTYSATAAWPTGALDARRWPAGDGLKWLDTGDAAYRTEHSVKSSDVVAAIKRGALAAPLATAATVRVRRCQLPVAIAGPAAHIIAGAGAWYRMAPAQGRAGWWRCGRSPMRRTRWRSARGPPRDSEPQKLLLGLPRNIHYGDSL
jgi:hypothetical protein